MKHNYYAMYDTVVEKFANPFMAENDAVAVRMFQNTLKQDEVFALNKNDMELHRIGTFEDVDGNLFGELELVVKGKSFNVEGERNEV